MHELILNLFVFFFFKFYHLRQHSSFEYKQVLCNVKGAKNESFNPFASFTSSLDPENSEKKKPPLFFLETILA